MASPTGSIYVGAATGERGAWVADSNGGKSWPIINLTTIPTPTLGTVVTGMGQLEDIAITPDGNTAWVTDYLHGNSLAD